MEPTKKWTENEDKFLITAIKNGNSAAEIAKFLGRSEKSVRRHSEELHIDVSEIKEKQNAKYFNLADVKCPFFEHFYRGKSIRCEGLTEYGCIILRCANEDEWKRHVKTYCNKNYNSCPIAKVLQSKYEGENQQKMR